MTIDKMNKEQEIVDLKKKIKEFSLILEKFGMDIITKLGNMSFNIKVLTNKIKELSDATIDIKALNPQLKKIVNNQNNLDEEIELLKSLIMKKAKSSKVDENLIKRDVEATDKKTLISNKIDNLKNKINTVKDPDIIINDLNELKDQIFEYTGGHKILYEISKLIKNIEKEREITSEIQNTIAEKSIFWKNKIL
ncbi:MAG: hypothetical protein KGD63_02185 [Candidatus Lokiarchaeota archaeon]|nr:hypothetical protein [Candidatus Lokiarchaeota archaeon]